MTDISVLSPVDKSNGIYIKRDDLFTPFEFSGANGGKLRQCIALVNKIKPKGIISLSSLYSPQLAIVPAVAKSKKVDCIMLLGGSKQTDMVVEALKQGATIQRCSSGRHNVLHSIAKKLQKDNGYFIVDYGMNANENIKEFYDTNADQVKNIPDKLDTMMVTCGSGITAAGIIYGLTKYKKQVGKIVLIGTAPDRMKKILERLKIIEAEYGSKIHIPKIVYDNLYTEKDFIYERKEPVSFMGIDLHPNYEAKTIKRFMQKHFKKKEKTLIWIVGGKIC